MNRGHGLPPETLAPKGSLVKKPIPCNKKDNTERVGVKNANFETTSFMDAPCWSVCSMHVACLCRRKNTGQPEHHLKHHFIDLQNSAPEN